VTEVCATAGLNDLANQLAQIVPQQLAAAMGLFDHASFGARAGPREVHDAPDMYWGFSGVILLLA
jgi:hypothetical protein